ncbi:MAG: 50S ribosomal protein L22 [Armatimonadetes bacterium]|nr:50S ribosomal protein L22 [Armatimonadota bacterium]
MGKPKTEPRVTLKQASATAKFLQVPPRKARLVMDVVRGKYVADALATLKFVPNFAARAIEKVIGSAVANAENGRPFDQAGRPIAALNTDNLKLVSGRVDEGPRMKRVQPRAQGRAYRILKRMCHISVIVEEVEPKPRPLRRDAASRRARAAGRVVSSPTRRSESKPTADRTPVQSDAQRVAVASRDATPSEPQAE